ncbi:MAG: hypothetical protein HYS38_05845 [Acidobacteria bacterium]|nr:hypothetical protein [Acidobacteriota bacterium]
MRCTPAPGIGGGCRDYGSPAGDIPGCVVRKRHGTAWGVSGDPDLYGSINGHHFEIEVKRRGQEPTPLQHARLAEWRRGGALVGVAHSVEEALAIIRPALK